MAKRITDQSQDEIEAMVVDGEQSGELPETAGMSHINENNGSHTPNRSREELVDCDGTTSNYVEISKNGTESKVPRKAASRPRKKTAQPPTPVSEGEASAPKPATTRKRKTSAPSAQLTTEEQAASASKPATTRKRKTSAPSAQSDADAAPRKTPARRRKTAVEATPTQAAEQMPTLPVGEQAIEPEPAPVAEKLIAGNERTDESSEEQPLTATPEIIDQPASVQETALSKQETDAEGPENALAADPLTEEQLADPATSASQVIASLAEPSVREEMPESGEEQPEQAETSESAPQIEEVALEPPAREEMPESGEEQPEQAETSESAPQIEEVALEPPAREEMPESGEEQPEQAETSESAPQIEEVALEPPAREEWPGLAATEMMPQIEGAALTLSGIVERAPAVAAETVEAPVTVERGHLVRSAALVSIGNLGSSLLGMVRQIVVTGLGSGIAGPFNAALAPVNTFYQLLVNGSTDGALIPVFNEYAAEKKHDEMRRVVFTVVNLVGIIALIASLGYLLISPWFVDFLVNGYPGADRTLTLQFSQIIFFSLVVLGPFAVLLAALFSLKEFGWPAFATAAYHAGIIMGATVASLIGLKTWGIIALPIGLAIGSAGQIALLLPGIRKHRLSYMFVLDLKHPALKRIYHLYWPIAVSYVFSTVMVLLDVHLQSWTPQHAAGTTALAAATVLIQFPTGLVAQALSIAVLPTLSEHARAGNMERFKETLLLGIRLGLLLMIPAMTGLLMLRTPIIYAIFAHHNYSLADADLGALALQNYAYQLPFLAIDQLMIAAFYARKNTKVPVIVYVVSILFYLAVALPFYSTIGVAALAFANTLQNSMHAIILLVLLRMAIGSLHLRRTAASVLKICLAAAFMAVVAWIALTLLGHVGLFSLKRLSGQILTLVVAGGLASVVYFGALWLFKVEEIKLVKGAILAKLGKHS